MNYDTHLFVEIIESVPGIQFLRTESRDGFVVRFYQGVKGNLVEIDFTEPDEPLPVTTGAGYLSNLGLDHLIESMFPNTKNVRVTLPFVQGDSGQ